MPDLVFGRLFRFDDLNGLGDFFKHVRVSKRRQNVFFFIVVFFLALLFLVFDGEGGDRSGRCGNGGRRIPRFRGLLREDASTLTR